MEFTQTISLRPARALILAMLARIASIAGAVQKKAASAACANDSPKTGMKVGNTSPARHRFSWDAHVQGSLTCLFFFLFAIALASCSQSGGRFTDHKAMSTELVALFRVRVGGKFAYIDKTGRVTIPPQFDAASRFSEGLAAVRIGDDPVKGKWGYIDQIGRFAIKPRFSKADDFSNGLALVSTIEDIVPNIFINKLGDVVIAPNQFKKDSSTSAHVYFPSDFAEGLAVITDQEKGKSGYIDTEGKIAIAPQFDVAFDFHEGLAEVKVFPTNGRESNGRELIDKSGRVVVGPIKLCPELFTGPFYFSEGYAAAQSECFRNWGFLDKSGRFVIEPRFGSVGIFSEDLAIVGFEIPGAPPPSDLASESTKAFFRAIAKFGNGSIDYPGMKYGYIHKSGVLVVPARFEGGGIFSEGLAAVQLKGKCGYIDKAGHLVIPAIFDVAHPFSGGLAEVAIGEQWGYIDKSGTYVWKAP